MKKASKSLKNNFKFLQTLPENIKKKKFAKEISCCQIKCLSEIVRNLLIGNIPIKKENIDKLKPYKNYMYKLGKKINFHKNKT